MANMFGTMEFQKECAEKGIKPIYGAELYIAPKSRFEKNKEEKYYHILVLAKDNEGYSNLAKLVSIGYLEGYYSKPRIDRETLAENSRGLVILTACISGEIPHHIIREDEKSLESAIAWYMEVFGRENFFLEVQHHNISEELIITKKMAELSKKYGLSLAATNDSHYVKPGDAKLQEIVFAIRDKKLLSDTDRYRFQNDSFYLKSPVEMERLFSELPEAISNTSLITEMCNVALL